MESCDQRTCWSMAREAASIRTKTFHRNSEKVRFFVKKYSFTFPSNKIIFCVSSVFLLIRLRKGIETTPENWTNCFMCVQDLVRLDVNITAEISKEAAENFQFLCQTFAKKETRT